MQIPSIAFNSLTARIIVSLFVMLILGMFLLAVYLYQTTGELRRTVVYVDAHRLVKGVTSNSELTQLPLSIAGDSVDYTLYDKQGRVLWFSANLQRPRRLKPDILANQWYKYLFAEIGRNISVPVVLEDGNTLMISMNDKGSRELIESFVEQRVNRALWLIIPLSIILSLLIMPLLLRWLLRSIKQASKIAADIQPLGKVQRIPTKQLPSEIRPLADAANHALSRLELAYLAERRFVADAAHELRTPLTVISLQLELLKSGQSHDFSIIQYEMKQLQLLLNQLLQLARLENNGDGMDQEQRIQVSRVLRHSVVAMLPTFEELQREVKVVITPEAEKLCKSASEVLFHEIFTNLLNNALIHGDGNVEVKLHIVGERMQIAVSDQGTSLQSHSKKELCSRFYKRLPDSPGSGLGLSIVNEIVENLNAELSLQSSPHTKFSITF